MVDNLGLRIRTRRKELGLTQTELAHKLGLKCKTSVSKVELGEDNLTTVNIKKYAKALETTPQWLMGLNESYDSEMEQKIESAHQQAEEDAKLVMLYHELNESNRKIAVAQIKALLMCQSAEK